MTGIIEAQIGKAFPAGKVFEGGGFDAAHIGHEATHEDDAGPGGRSHGPFGAGRPRVSDGRPTVP